MTADPLILRFGGSLVEQLGAQLYPSVTSTVAELISNAWDAEAQSVWVEIPFETWRPTDRITVVDDGLGMRRDEAQHAYLIVGRPRRKQGRGEMSENGLRRVHGRKGIGKLAAFGTAGVLECATVRDGDLTTFRLDYDHIRQLQAAEDYEVEPAADVSPPMNPDTGVPLAHGTRIMLTALHNKRALSEDQFLRSMSRRFALAEDKMAVHINGQRLVRFNMPVAIKFPRDEAPEGVTIDGEWAIEAIANERTVRWWIGFTAKPLDDETAQGVSILANGKMAHRPFMFARSQGVTGQLGQEYLVGEVEANWLDTGVDVDDDLIQSNRDMLQLEDPRVAPVLEWGRKRLAWALRRRASLLEQRAIDSYETSDTMQAILDPLPAAEQRSLKKIAITAAKIPEIDASGVESIVRSVYEAREATQVRRLIDQIESAGSDVQVGMWDLVRQFGLIDARRVLSLVEARLSTIEKLQGAIDTGLREVPDIHDIVRRDPWLLDPRWQYLDDEIDMASFGIEFQPEQDETGNIIDFMFALRPRPPATVDQIIIVEIKRGSLTNGTLRRATEPEVYKFHSYVNQAARHEGRNTTPARVRGLMVAQAYTASGDVARQSLETTGNVQLEFKTWDRVIDETHRMHLGWLEITRERGISSESADETN